jgi:hypothetical protein
MKTIRMNIANERQGTQMFAGQNPAGSLPAHPLRL